MASLTRAATEGMPRPQSKELQNYWSPFNELFVRVLDLKTPPTEAVKIACAAMNKANGK
jgi:maltose-binding protein MalE